MARAGVTGAVPLVLQLQPLESSAIPPEALFPDELLSVSTGPVSVSAPKVGGVHIATGNLLLAIGKHRDGWRGNQPT